MSEGRIVQYDSPEVIYENPANTFIAYFVGIPAMNLIPASLQGSFLVAGDLRYDVSRYKHLLEPRGTEFILGIRAENIEVSLSEKVDKEWLKMKCSMIESLGALLILHLEGAGIYVKAKVRRIPVSEGDSVWIRLKPEKVKIFDKKSRERII